MLHIILINKECGMNTKEKKYTEEFKKQIVELYENGKSVIDQDLRIWLSRTDNLQMDSPLLTICKKTNREKK